MFSIDLLSRKVTLTKNHKVIILESWHLAKGLEKKTQLDDFNQTGRRREPINKCLKKEKIKPFQQVKFQNNIIHIPVVLACFKAPNLGGICIPCLFFGWLGKVAGLLVTFCI
jgi:hypothetical protein